MHQLLRCSNSTSSTRRALKKYNVLAKKEQKKEYKRQQREMMISLQQETSCHGERPVLNRDLTRPSTSSRQSYAHNSFTLADPARNQLLDRQMMPETKVSIENLSLLTNERRKFTSFRDSISKVSSLPRSQRQKSRRLHPTRPTTDSWPGPPKDTICSRQERPTKNIQPHSTYEPQAVQTNRRISLVSLTDFDSIELNLGSESTEFEMFESEFFPEGI